MKSRDILRVLRILVVVTSLLVTTKGFDEESSTSLMEFNATLTTTTPTPLTTAAGTTAPPRIEPGIKHASDSSLGWYPTRFPYVGTTISEDFVTETDTDIDSEIVWSWYRIRWSWWLICQVLSSVIGVLGNGVVIVIIFTRVQNKRSTDTLIGSLAISDFLTSVFLFPIPWAKTVPPSILGVIYCKFLFPNFLLWLCITVSTYQLVAICIERYVAVVHPLYFARAFSERKVSMIVVFTWLFSLAQCIYTFFIIVYDDDIHYCAQTAITPAGKAAIAYYAFGIRLVIPVGAMLITQIVIVRSLNIQSKRHGDMVSAEKSNAAPSFHIVARNRVIKMLLIVVIVYCVAWMPNQIAYLCFNLGYLSPSYRGSALHRALTVMGFLNSCANPFIYTSRHPEFRAALRALFTCSSETTPMLFESRIQPANDKKSPPVPQNVDDSSDRSTRQITHSA
ncbi:galanin receptor 2a-like [Diadema antillarum]|uniref:galanin receptor 2a-like n=1 Tax=Diadema antillarum TaxID=105358 RepID=UPI003A8884FD